jgi:hypothetical protein
MEQKVFNNAKTSSPKILTRKQCCQIMLLLRHYAAISPVSLRPPSKAKFQLSRPIIYEELLKVKLFL